MTTVVMSIIPGALPRRAVRPIAARLGLDHFDQRRLERDVAERCDVLGHCGDDACFEVLSPNGQWRMSQSQLLDRMREQVLERAVEGDVLITGWAAAALLQPFAGIIRVLVNAPDDFRSRQIKDQLAFEDIRTACLERASVDGTLSRFVRRACGCDWQDAADFDLVIDAARVPVMVIPALIEQLIAAGPRPAPGNAREALALALRRMRLCEPIETPLLDLGRPLSR